MSRQDIILCGIVGVVLLALTCTADNSSQDLSIEQIFDMAQNVLNATSEWQNDLMDISEGRKSKFLPFAGAGLLPFHALCKYRAFDLSNVLKYSSEKNTVNLVYCAQIGRHSFCVANFPI